MADLGRAALFVSLGLALYATVAGAWAARTQKRRLADSAGNALLAALGSTAVAAAVLLSALVRHDFSFVYVAQHTSSELPTGYSMSAFWGGQEGSLLLWLLVLTAYAAAAVLLNRRRAPDLVALDRAGARRRLRLLRVHARRRLEPVRHADGARSRAPA